MTKEEAIQLTRLILGENLFVLKDATLSADSRKCLS